MFFSTHVLEVAEKLCTRIGVIDHGTLRAQGTLEELRSGEKGASLEEYFGAEKWSDYQILIHSVKSTSKTIGSEELFLLAKSLEEAAGAKDTDYINNNHQTFMDKYRKLAASIDAAIR